MAYKIRPLSDRLVVQIKEEAEKVTAGGLILAGTAAVETQPSIEAVVLHAGPGLYVKGERQQMEVKEGDRIMFSGFSGNTMTVNGEKFRVIRESDVLCALEGGE